MNDALIVAGYQGNPGAFGDQATREAFGDVKTKSYQSFADLLTAVQRGEIHAALVPSENTIAGRIATARQALAARPQLHVAGQIRLRIEQCLIEHLNQNLERCDRLHRIPSRSSSAGAFSPIIRKLPRARVTTPPVPCDRSSRKAIPRQRPSDRHLPPNCTVRACCCAAFKTGRKIIRRFPSSVLMN